MSGGARGWPAPETFSLIKEGFACLEVGKKTRGQIHAEVIAVVDRFLVDKGVLLRVGR